MKALTMIALANYFEKAAKPLKGNLRKGEHLIDETLVLKVKGVIKKGEDVEYTPTIKIPMLATLALFIEKSGIVGDNISNMLVESMNEALEMKDEVKSIIEHRLKDITAAEKRVQELTKKLDLATRNGSCNVKIECKSVEFESSDYQNDTIAA